VRGHITDNGTASGVAQDVSKQKEFEEALIAAKDEAESANRLKSEFLANMSHEIRTPMNAILGFAELLSAGSFNLQQRSYLSGIVQAGKSLLALINDILDLSKIEAGRLMMGHDVVDLRFVCNDLASIFAVRTQEKGLQFELALSERIPKWLLLDEARLRQVLFNVLGNAVKFTECGFVRFSVDVLPSGDTSDAVQVIIEIADSGIGIAPEYQQRIFQPFTQQEGSNTRRFGGTGLGLALTRRLVELMNGTISVSSTVNVGSTFTIMLPGVICAENVVQNAVQHNPSLPNDVSEVRDSASYDFRPYTAPYTAHSAGSYTESDFTEQQSRTDHDRRDADNDTISRIAFEPATILVVDDIEANRVIVRGILESYANLTVLEAESAAEAIEIVQRFMPDIIIIDVQTMDGDGAKTITALRAQQQMSDVPIIALAASVLDEDVSRIRQLCEGLLTKPISQRRLLNELARFLPHRIVASDPSAPLHTAVPMKEETSLRSLCPEPLQSLIDSELLPQWQSISSTMSNLDIEEFALLFQQYAAFYDAQAATHYAKQLYEVSSTFRLHEMTKLFQQFPTLFGSQTSSQTTEPHTSTTNASL
jgi:CheY-like chemotaxis protein